MRETQGQWGKQLWDNEGKWKYNGANNGNNGRKMEEAIVGQRGTMGDNGGAIKGIMI